MAKTANSENIKRDEEGPDFSAAIDLVRGRLRTNDSNQRSLAQDNSTLYKRIEKDHGVNSASAKDFARFDKMAPEKRTGHLRHLLGMLSRAGYDNFDDLVDRAEKPTAKGKSMFPAPDALGEQDISKAEVDPEIEAQRAADAKTFDESNVHRLAEKTVN